MALVLSVFALVGLLIFIIFGVLWIVTPARRANFGLIALIGLLIWAVASVVSLIDTIF